MLNALLCTSPQTNPLIGEASYLRLLLHPYRAALGLFDQHTRYAFETQESLLAFHRRLVAQVVDAYWRSNGEPNILILKDPLLTPHLRLVHDLIPAAEVILILRNPVDVIASRLRVQDRLGVERNADRIISEHNMMLTSVLEAWDLRPPRVVTYSQMGESGLRQIRRVTALNDINSTKIWFRSRKVGSAETAWQTNLVGQPINAFRRPVDLDSGLIRRIKEECLPLCLDVLGRAGIGPGPYWSFDYC